MHTDNTVSHVQNNDDLSFFYIKSDNKLTFYEYKLKILELNY